MRAMIQRLVVCVLAMLQGCAANQLAITYQSDPPGATFYQDGKNMGYTPVTLYYPVSEQDRARGYAICKGAAVRWVSGASAQITHIRADLALGGRQQFNFVRPTGVPGTELDAAYAIELRKLALQQRQIDVNAAAAALNYLGQQQQYQQYIMNRHLYNNISCTSRAMGNTVYTNCY